MAIDRFDFDAVTEADINQLIANGVAEGYKLEFKRETYSTNDSAKREFLKDVTAFANSAGGHLVIGIAETDSIATSAHPISVPQADTEILRMESLLRDGVEPRIAGVRIRAVPIAGGVVLALRVPRSWNQPHRVSLGGANKF